MMIKKSKKKAKKKQKNKKREMKKQKYVCNKGDDD
jgi:hypothetical protein